MSRHMVTSPTSRLAIPSGSDSSQQDHHHHRSYEDVSGANMTPVRYLSRMLDIQQMDIQSALDQMKTLCSAQPGRVYKTSYYRKQTKNHWARDDPAFAALQICFLALSSLSYCVAFRSETMIASTIGFALRSILINWLATGVAVAAAGRALANAHLTNHSSSTHVRQSVEWLYAWDIHCNAFFPLFVLLYAVQYFLLPVVLMPGLLSLILSNTLYAAAFSIYFYITHLGYRALPFLSNTEVFLFPIAGVVGLYVLNLIGYPFGFGWNASRIMAHFYFD